MGLSLSEDGEKANPGFPAPAPAPCPAPGTQKGKGFQGLSPTVIAGLQGKKSKHHHHHSEKKSSKWIQAF